MENKNVHDQLPIPLKPNQVPHFYRCLSLLHRLQFFLDTSLPGSGKTLTTSSLQYILQFRWWVVICTKSLFGNWKSMEPLYDRKITHLLTYESLRSSFQRQPQHGLLIRRDFEKSHLVEFESTPLWESMCQEGVFLVMDEVQKVKNLSAQQKACRALITGIQRHTSTSSFACLSGSPFDKVEHVINFLSLINWIDSSSYPLGLDEVKKCIYHCQRILPEEKKMEWNRCVTPLRLQMCVSASHEAKAQFCFDIFVKFVLPEISSAMSKPMQKIAFTLDVKNGIYSLDTIEEKLALKTYIQLLASSVRYNRYLRTVELDQKNFGQMTQALMGISSCKVPILRRLTYKRLIQDPHCKVILFLTYRQDIDSLAFFLADFSPIVFTGDVPEEKRTRLVSAFQQDNDEHRLFISNLQIGSLGISLHDLYGGRKRITFVIPDFSIQNLLQAVFRSFREGTQNDAEVRFVYGDTDDVEELPILNALARKTSVLKETLPQQVADQVFFPGDYPKEFSRE